MPSWLLEAAQLGFSVVVAGVLLKFLLNDVTHKLNRIIELLEKLTRRD